MITHLRLEAVLLDDIELATSSLQDFCTIGADVRTVLRIFLLTGDEYSFTEENPLLALVGTLAANASSEPLFDRQVMMQSLISFFAIIVEAFYLRNPSCTNTRSEPDVPFLGLSWFDLFLSAAYAFHEYDWNRAWAC